MTDPKGHSLIRRIRRVTHPQDVWIRIDGSVVILDARGARSAALFAAPSPYLAYVGRYTPQAATRHGLMDDCAAALIELRTGTVTA